MNDVFISLCDSLHPNKGSFGSRLTISYDIEIQKLMHLTTAAYFLFLFRLITTNRSQEQDFKKEKILNKSNWSS